MKPMFAAPAGALDKKPKHGDPCTRCGLCCMATLCTLGRHVFRRPELPGPCPGLVKETDGTYSCDVAADPLKYTTRLASVEALRRAARVLIGAGDGCDARFNGEWRNALFSDMLESYYRFGNGRELVRRARKTWGIS